MKSKHILFISSWYPNRNNTTHGIFNRYFAEAVSLYNKVSVLHVCSDENITDDLEFDAQEDVVRTVTVYYKKVTSRLPVISVLQKRNKLLKAFEAGYRQLFAPNEKPDLIHLNVVMPLGIGALYLSEKFNIPFVVNENWSGYTTEDGNYKGLFLKKITQRIISKAKAVLPTSEWLRKAMQSHDLKGNYQVIPNVVDTGRFVPGAVNRAGSTTNFLHISSLNDREKNVSGILRAFVKALERESQIQLCIVGSGVDEEMYKLMVKQTGTEDKIQFVGKLLSVNLVKRLQDTDALLMFSNYETFSLVNIEAFACGKPVITSDAGAIPEYMIPQLGYMVKRKDEEALTEAIISFTKNKRQFDPVFIRNYAVTHFSYEKVGKELDAIYDNVLNQN